MDAREPWTCPLCGYHFFTVESTWTVKNGDIHRRRICALCEQWGFVSVESQQSPTNGKVAGEGGEPVYIKPSEPAPTQKPRRKKT